jgi:hypothetical protein
MLDLIVFGLGMAALAIFSAAVVWGAVMYACWRAGSRVRLPNFSEPHAWYRGWFSRRKA